MKKLLYILILFQPIISLAQINSSKVYYYKYKTTKGSGVCYEGTTTPMNSQIYAILLAGRYMEYRGCGSVGNFQKELANNSRYWENLVKKDFEDFRNRYNNPPTSKDFAMSQTNLPSWESLSLVATVNGYKYNPSLSDGDITTYTSGVSAAYTQGPSGFSMPKYWSEWSVKNMCFTFFNDLSKMLIWNRESPHDMLVFERVSLSELQPNIDDLKKNFNY